MGPFRKFPGLSSNVSADRHTNNVNTHLSLWISLESAMGRGLRRGCGTKLKQEDFFLK